ncbi:unnamed protein product [Adineta steineri]|uniref:G-protein coupled receptors family 1 profile domain-containing protein n=1 Tax=Adineta steineri TaxID=433720 RepID=A0A814EKP0_9BILA|nr:unnamed protein product [Adineta steineri]
MSASYISSLNFIAQQMTIYLGIPILISGLIGGLINVIVFLSLQTFRQNSCAFYLTIMSIVNIGHLSTGLLTRILISGFNIDPTQTSIFYCKFRAYFVQVCISMSLTCMCFATIDQFLATCHSQRWQQWSNIKVAHRLIIGSLIIWLLHGIQYWIYYNLVKLVTTSQNTCISTNYIFQLYNIGVYSIILNGLLPIFISILFGLLAYRNVHDLSYRTIPLVRRELDKQLTVIVLIQVISNFITAMPYAITNILTLNATIMNDVVNLAKLRFITVMVICILYLNFASPFYMYICVSARFRQQFIYVFYKMHCKKWQRRRIAVNQVIP